MLKSRLKNLISTYMFFYMFYINLYTSFLHVYTYFLQDFTSPDNLFYFSVHSPGEVTYIPRYVTYTYVPYIHVRIHYQFVHHIIKNRLLAAIYAHSELNNEQKKYYKNVNYKHKFLGWYIHNLLL